MTNFAIYVAAILNLLPAVGRSRAETIARQIDTAARNVDDGLMLVVINRRESDFSAAVERCDVTGDGGRAISAYQLHPHLLGRYSREQVCQDPVLAARIALWTLGRDGTPAERFGRYAGRSTQDRKIVQRVQDYEAVQRVKDSAN